MNLQFTAGAIKNSRRAKLKILMVLGLSNPFRGAAWTRIGFFAKCWTKNGNKVDVLGTFTPKTVRKRGSKTVDETTVYNIIPHMISSNPLAFVFDTITSFLVTAIMLGAKRPDVTLISMPPGDVGLGAIMACRVTGIKYVVEYRDEWEKYEINRNESTFHRKSYTFVKTLMSKLLQKSPLVVTVTSLFAHNLRLRGIKNVEVIPNGADVTVFEPINKNKVRKKLGISPDDFVVVYTGIIGDYYRLDVVVRALAKLEGDLRDKVKLLLIGDGPDVPEVMKITRELGLENTVNYLGTQKIEELSEIVAASDVSIVPGFYAKGQVAVKFFESSACGIPTISITPEDSLLAKVINEEEIGINLPSMSEDALAKAILEIYENERFRIAAGKKARKFVEKGFDRKKLAEKYSKRILQHVNSS
jgi:glycosyltransferase involved in cell wall biosynthesis